MPSPHPSATEVLGWTQKILDACGPRPAGSEACRKAADLIAADLRQWCDRAEVQSFTCHPLAFLWYAALTLPLAALGSGLLVAGHPLPAAALLFVVLAASLAEFGFYRELMDPLFPRRECRNVLGVIEPAGPVVRQVVLGAHHDSAFEFPFLRFGKKPYVAALACVGAMLYVLPFVAGAAGLLGLPREVELGAGVFGLLACAISAFVVSPRAVPGAGDNLVSSGMLVYVARELRERLRADPQALAGTRVLLASFDAEESGLRGSRAFVRENRALLLGVPTVQVNLESFFHADSLCALVTDLNGTVPLSQPLAELLGEETRAQGLPFTTRKMIFGLGATDAAEFARAGIPATCLVGMSPSPLHPKPLPYHTRQDLPENLEPEAVAAGAEISLRMVLRLATRPQDFARARGEA